MKIIGIIKSKLQTIIEESEKLYESLKKIAIEQEKYAGALQDGHNAIQSLSIPEFATAIKNISTVFKDKLASCVHTSEVNQLIALLVKHLLKCKAYQSTCFDEVNIIFTEVKKMEKECTKIETQIETNKGNLEKFCAKYDSNGASANLLLDFMAIISVLKKCIHNYSAAELQYTKSCDKLSAAIKLLITSFNIFMSDHLSTMAIAVSNMMAYAINAPIGTIEYQPNKVEDASVMIETTYKIKKYDISRYQEYERMLKDGVDHDTQYSSFTYMQTYMTKLKNNIALKEEEKLKLNDGLEYASGREYFGEVIKEMKYFKCSVPQIVYDDFAGALLAFLSAMHTHQDYNYKMLYAILLFSRKVWTQKDTRKIYLLSTLSSCTIWKDVNRWKLMLELLVKEKIKCYESSIDSTNKGVFSKIISVIRKKHDDTDGKEAMVFQLLKSFNFLLLNLKIPIQSAVEIIADVAQKNDLAKERLNLLIMELKSGNKVVTERHCYYEVKSKVLQKYSSIYNGHKGIILLHLSLKMFSVKDLLGVGSACKSLRKICSELMYKQILCQTVDISLEKRAHIWEKILELDGLKRDYNAFKSKLMSKAAIISQSEVDDDYIGFKQINLDIERSFIHIYKNKEDYKHILSNILKLYTLVFPDIEYCQGMNVIAGFFICIFKNEETIFKNFLNFMNKFRFFYIFENNLEGVQQFIYELERLSSMYLPDLHYHLQVECVSYSFFASSWFLTIFTNTLQKSESTSFPPLLLSIWNMYLLDGWKAVFRSAIIFMHCCQYELLSQSMEAIHVNIQKLLATFLDGKVIDEKQFNEIYLKSPITNALIEEFAKDYKKLKILNNK